MTIEDVLAYRVRSAPPLACLKTNHGSEFRCLDPDLNRTFDLFPAPGAITLALSNVRIEFRFTPSQPSSSMLIRALGIIRFTPIGLIFENPSEKPYYSGSFRTVEVIIVDEKSDPVRYRDQMVSPPYLTADAEFIILTISVSTAKIIELSHVFKDNPYSELDVSPHFTSSNEVFYSDGTMRWILVPCLLTGLDFNIRIIPSTHGLSFDHYAVLKAYDCDQ